MSRPSFCNELSFSNVRAKEPNSDLDGNGSELPDAEEVTSDDESTLHGKVLLKDSIEISKLCSKEGTVFEISEEEQNKEFAVNYYDSLHYDKMLSNLSLGTNYADNKNILDSSDDDLEPFEKLAKNMVDISGDGGVLKEEVYPGVGSDLPEGMTVTFHYNAYFEYADEPFDSTYLRNRPQRTMLKDASVVPGLKIGLMTMRKKEKSRFLVKPSYAFGSMGCPPRIPGDAIVLFEVTILDAIDHSAADDFENLDDEHQKRAPFSERLDAAKAYHRKANAAYRDRNYLKAKDNYKNALRVIEYCYVKNEEESRKQCEMMSRMYSNLAQVSLDLKLPARACTDCKNAFDVPFDLPDDMKAKLYFRFAKAKMLLDDYDASHTYLKKAHKLKPNNADITNLLEKLCTKKLKYLEREKIMCQGIFKDYNMKKYSASEVVSNSDKNLLSNENCNTALVGVDKTEKQGKNVEFSVNDETPVLPNIRPEFEEAVKDQFEDFILNESVKELSLPTNLNTEEMAYIFAAAKAVDLKIEKIFVGPRTFLRLCK